jgi:hypothetical protein
VTVSTETLDQRVARLERQKRWLGVLVAIIVVLLVALFALARRPSGPAALVEAEKFVVRDREGRTRAVLGLDYATAPEHSPVRLALYNDEQRASAVLYLSEGFTGLTIKTGAPEVERSISLFANPKDGAGVGVSSGHGGNAVRMTADAAGAVRVVLQDAAGHVVFRAP